MCIKCGLPFEKNSEYVYTKKGRVYHRLCFGMRKEKDEKRKGDPYYKRYSKFSTKQGSTTSQKFTQNEHQVGLLNSNRRIKIQKTKLERKKDLYDPKAYPPFRFKKRKRVGNFLDPSTFEENLKEAKRKKRAAKQSKKDGEDSAEEQQG